LNNPSEEKEKRFKNFSTLLQNPRYHNPGLKLYGYLVKTLSSKIAQVRYQKDPADHVFGDNPIPEEILGLIQEDQLMEVAARAKTIQNCLKELRRVQKQAAYKQPGLLLKSLLKIFNSYGKINFAQENTVYGVDGYQIGRCLVRFYNDPARTHLELPDNLHPEVMEVVKSLVDGERGRQMRNLY
jgi:hypothetical protein